MLDLPFLQTCVSEAAERLARIRNSMVSVWDLAIARCATLPPHERHELGRRIRAVTTHATQAYEMLNEALDHLDYLEEESAPVAERGPRHSGERARTGDPTGDAEPARRRRGE